MTAADEQDQAIVRGRQIETMLVRGPKCYVGNTGTC